MVPSMSNVITRTAPLIPSGTPPRGTRARGDWRGGREAKPRAGPARETATAAVSVWGAHECMHARAGCMGRAHQAKEVHTRCVPVHVSVCKGHGGAPSWSTNNRVALSLRIHRRPVLVRGRDSPSTHSANPGEDGLHSSGGSGREAAGGGGAVAPAVGKCASRGCEGSRRAHSRAARANAPSPRVCRLCTFARVWPRWSM